MTSPLDYSFGKQHGAFVGSCRFMPDKPTILRGPQATPGAPGGDLPTTIAGNQFYFKGNALSGSNGDPITFLPDSSGNGYDAVEDGTYKGATLALDTFGTGVHSVDFNVANTQYVLPSAVRDAINTAGECEGFGGE